jgi:acetolactate synthase-1/2/3 large subunit
VLQALIDAVRAARRAPAGSFRDSAAAQEIATVKSQWLEEWLPQLTSNETPINPYRIIWDLMHAVDRRNTILTHDAGSPRDQIVPFWECQAPHTYIGWGKTTQLGFGLGAIMGAKLAAPDKLCINVMGDSAIGMVGMDLETAVRCRIGILSLVFNNGLMAIEKDTMKLANAKYDSYLVGGNYTELARALGCWSQRVEQPDGFLPALHAAIAITRTGQPAVIEVMTKEGIDFSRYP